MSGDRVTGSVIVPRTAITVGERVREDYGDISRLAASLKEWGQLVPIIVDTELKLCDGGRRLRALAEADIPDVLVLMREMTEAERRELEFEIDREHKPFNDLERSQAYVRKAVEAQQALNAKAEKEATNAPRVSPKTGRSAPRKQVTRRASSCGPFSAPSSTSPTSRSSPTSPTSPRRRPTARRGSGRWQRAPMRQSASSRQMTSTSGRG
jgi:hypothetical protein